MRGLLLRVVLLLAVISLALTAWSQRHWLTTTIEQLHVSQRRSGPAPDLATYQTLSTDLEEHRKRLGQSYLKASIGPEQEDLLAQTRELLQMSLPRLMRCWLGTPWDFNGTAHEPGTGKVACGYFVSSVLQDAGFEVEWAPLAQQASQNILGTFLPPEKMRIRVGMDYDAFLQEVLLSGPGIYIVGLDSHVAFLVITSSREIRFIHSSGSSPYCVIDEPREHSHVLRNSDYRVIGNLTASDEVLHKWLLGEKFRTQTR